MLSLLDRWMPLNGSEHGPALDVMNAWVHWLMAILFVGWGLYFVYVLFRFRAKANPKASYEGAESHFSSYIEGGVAVVEVLLLVFFAIPAWARWVTPPPPGEDPLIVRVVAQQFAWNVHYPGPDGVFGRTDINLISPTNLLGLDRSDPAAADDGGPAQNQLHLEQNRPVTILLSSQDVIHSFFLPQMRVKQDAVPGMLIPVHFKPTMATPPESRLPACNAEKNCWEIACAQLCGLSHYSMKGFYTVHTPEEFDAWMADRQARLQPAPPAAAPEAAAPDDQAADDQAGAEQQADDQGDEHVGNSPAPGDAAGAHAAGGH